MGRYVFVTHNDPNSGLFVQNALIEYIGVYSGHQSVKKDDIFIHLK